MDAEEQKPRAGFSRGIPCQKCGSDYWYKMFWNVNGKWGHRCGPCSVRLRLKWKSRNPKKYREWSWKQRGISMTVSEYERLEHMQGHSCALCHKPTKRMVVDHDHQTRIVRGLLCRRCNVLAQDAEILRAVLAYVEGGGAKSHGDARETG